MEQDRFSFLIYKRSLVTILIATWSLYLLGGPNVALNAWN